MDNEPEVIREQMEQTRSSLQDKLETLEQHVTDTVQGAADAATETVQTVKDAVQETVETVKDTVHETVSTVKDSLDLSQHVRNHPWPMLAGAVMAGYVCARLVPRPRSAATMKPASVARNAMDSSGSGQGQRNGHHAAQPKEPNFLDRMMERYRDELGRLEGLAIGVVANVLREIAVADIPPALAQPLSEIVDAFTSKLGGIPIREPLFRREGTTSQDTGSNQHYDSEVPVSTAG